MSEEPDNLVLTMFRDIRERLDRLEAMPGTLGRIEDRVNELYETSTYALGLAGSCHLRRDTMQSELNALAARVTHLEEKV
jgi:hypothetical protein